MKPKNVLRYLRRSLWISVVLLPGQNFANEQAVTSSGPPSPVEPIANYAKWKKVNKTPVIMSPSFASDCVPPTPYKTELEKNDPHKNKFINVYVNEPGYAEFTSKKEPHYPEGTIIVKEKLAGTNSPAELLTVMIKRKQGFDPENGDWDYFALNGKGTKVLSSGKTQNCQECHEMQKSEDYVFRRELGPDIWQAMK